MIIFIKSKIHGKLTKDIPNKTTIDYWKIDRYRYDSFIEDLQIKYNSNINDFNVINQEMGYYIDDDVSLETFNNIFKEYSEFIIRNI